MSGWFSAETGESRVHDIYIIYDIITPSIVLQMSSPSVTTSQAIASAYQQHVSTLSPQGTMSMAPHLRQQVVTYMRQNEEQFTEFLVSCPASADIQPANETEQEKKQRLLIANKTFIAYCTHMSQVSLDSPVQVVCRTLSRGCHNDRAYNYDARCPGRELLAMTVLDLCSFIPLTC